jgi:hypothetical protein
MDVQISELHTKVDVVDGPSLLAPDTIDRIVKAVLRALEGQQQSEQMLKDDLDMRSIVDQQRGGKR